MCSGEFSGRDRCIRGALHYAGKNYSETGLKKPAGYPTSVIWQTDKSLPELPPLQMEADSSDPNVAIEDLRGDMRTEDVATVVAAPDPYAALAEEIAAAAEFARGLRLSHHWYRMLDRAGECRVDCCRA